ncbi:MAG TPA: winged helix-turn-helix transcriptional regulator [Candidatus Thermoplasmatota archaeon]|nr:winged helix-turn-helix transcriptional regulator [Candidatus Thermoplasmatota archaeon]
MPDIPAQTGAPTALGPAGAPLREQPLRRRLLGLIERRPGLHASELARESGQPWGTVQYHLSLLQKGQAVRVVEAGRERRFFPPGVDPTRARLLALLGQGRRPEIASFIRDHPGARQIDICGALEVSRKTFRSSVAPLVREGLVQERKGLQSNRYFPQPPLADLMALPPGALPERPA